MGAARNIRVEERGLEARGYREAPDDRRRILHVRGSSPRQAQRWCFVSLVLASISFVDVLLMPCDFWLFGTLGALSVLVLVGLFPLLVWRRAQWTRFELGPGGLVVASGPFGPRKLTLTSTGPPMEATLRPSRWGEPFVTLETWELHADRDGLRVHVATLYDEGSLRALDAFLARSSHALRSSAPITSEAPPALFPPGHAGAARDASLLPRTRHEFRCARGRVHLEAVLLAGLALLTFGSVLVTTTVGILAVHGAALATSAGTAVWLGSLILMLVLTTVLGRTLREQVRITDMRTRGRVILELGPEGIDLHTSPWWTRPLGPPDRRLPGRIELVVRRISHTPGEAFLDIVQHGHARRLHAPLPLEDAHDLVALVEGHEAPTRSHRSDREPSRAGP